MSNPYMSACLCVYTCACLSMYVLLVCGVCVSPFLGIFDSVNQGLNIIDHIDKNLTLEGLAIIHGKNKK